MKRKETQNTAENATAQTLAQKLLTAEQEGLRRSLEKELASTIKDAAARKAYIDEYLTTESAQTTIYNNVKGRLETIERERKVNEYIGKMNAANQTEGQTLMAAIEQQQAYYTNRAARLGTPQAHSEEEGVAILKAAAPIAHNFIKRQYTAASTAAINAGKLPPKYITELMLNAYQLTYVSYAAIVPQVDYITVEVFTLKEEEEEEEEEEEGRTDDRTDFLNEYSTEEEEEEAQEETAAAVSKDSPADILAAHDVNYSIEDLYWAVVDGLQKASISAELVYNENGKVVKDLCGNPVETGRPALQFKRGEDGTLNLVVTKTGWQITSRAVRSVLYKNNQRGGKSRTDMNFFVDINECMADNRASYNTESAAILAVEVDAIKAGLNERAARTLDFLNAGYTDKEIMELINTTSKQSITRYKKEIRHQAAKVFNVNTPTHKEERTETYAERKERLHKKYQQEERERLMNEISRNEKALEMYRQLVRERTEIKEEKEETEGAESRAE